MPFRNHPHRVTAAFVILTLGITGAFYGQWRLSLRICHSGNATRAGVVRVVDNNRMRAERALPATLASPTVSEDTKTNARASVRSLAELSRDTHRQLAPEHC